MCGNLNGSYTSSYPCKYLHLQQNLQRAQTCIVARSSWSGGQGFLTNSFCSFSFFFMHFYLRGEGLHEFFPLSSLYFNVSFVFGYLTWPRCWDPFFIFTIMMFRGGVGVTSHTPRIYFS
jgi:hypothetical protein